MSDTDTLQVTRLLNEAASGQTQSAAELLPLVYEQLRKVAQRQMSQERRDHTLSATALVHEAFARLAGNQADDWAGRGHFFKAAAEAMRRILIEHARGRARLKRGGGQKSNPRERISLDALQLATHDDPQEFLSVEEAVRRLEERDPDLGRIVQLRFFAGLTEQETASALGVSDRTVRRDWALARACLLRDLAGEAVA